MTIEEAKNIRTHYNLQNNNLYPSNGKAEVLGCSRPHARWRYLVRNTIAHSGVSLRTHINRELIELPDGVKDRNEATSQRIKSTGIKRKITPDQVRAIRVMLSGTHEDMMKIQESGRIDEWCNDNLQTNIQRIQE